MCPKFGHRRGSFSLLLKYGHLFITCSFYLCVSNTILLYTLVFRVTVHHTVMTSSWLSLFHSVAAQRAALRRVRLPGQLHHDRGRKSDRILRSYPALWAHNERASERSEEINPCLLPIRRIVRIACVFPHLM